jgi:alkanesulfonate monooxygenase SsuD/methylene tetrahydromethanopterin reductase-like flavin-dependent oxidoreductase (luciferase family)
MQVQGMKLGLFLPHVANPDFENLALKAETLGFEFICCDDHLMSPFEPEGSEGFGCYEAWTAMTYLAGRTQRIGINHMVLVPTFRGPGLLAKMAASLDQLSGGRLTLTVGAGWFQKEYDAFQIPWEKHSRRIAREREAVQVIRSLWTQPRLTFEGDFYQLHDAAVNPKPLQQPSPRIIVSGDSRPSMQLAAELGDGWMIHGRPPHEAHRLISAIRPLLGANAGKFEIASAVVVVFEKDESTARQKLQGMIPKPIWDLFMQADIKKEIRGGIYGPPARCGEALKAFAEAGLTSLTLVFPDPEDLDRFSNEVLPKLA